MTMQAIPRGGYKQQPKRIPRSLGFARHVLALDSVDDYVEVLNSPSLNPNSITLIAWIKINAWRTSIPYHESIVVHIDGTNGYFLAINHRSSLNKRLYLVSVSRGTNPGDFHGGTIEAGQWYQVGFIWEPITPTTSKQSLILNGQIIASRTIDIPVPDARTNNLQIGRLRGGWWETQTINGLINEVRIYNYNRALSAEEIRWNMLNYHNPIRNGLVLWLPMEEGAGEIVKDYSGHGNHGTLLPAGAGPTWERLRQWELRAAVE